jgi:hypothetical protein
MKNYLSISGLKCDNPNCDYADFTVPVEEYPNWINKPCPMYGENLLTEKAYKDVKMIMDSFEKIKDQDFDESELVKGIGEFGKDGIISMVMDEVEK